MSDSIVPQAIQRTIAPESRPRLAAKARVQLDRATGQPVLLHPEGVLMLNPTASAIIDLCDGERRFSDIITTLAERYGASPDQITADVAECLERLLEKRVIDLDSMESERAEAK